MFHSYLFGSGGRRESFPSEQHATVVLEPCVVMNKVVQNPLTEFSIGKPESAGGCVSSSNTGVGSPCEPDFEIKH